VFANELLVRFVEDFLALAARKGMQVLKAPPGDVRGQVGDGGKHRSGGPRGAVERPSGGFDQVGAVDHESSAPSRVATMAPPPKVLIV
jgi:hypothetical protein